MLNFLKNIFKKDTNTTAYPEQQPDNSAVGLAVGQPDAVSEQPENNVLPQTVAVEAEQPAENSEQTAAAGLAQPQADDAAALMQPEMPTEPSVEQPESDDEVSGQAVADTVETEVAVPAEPQSNTSDSAVPEPQHDGQPESTAAAEAETATEEPEIRSWATPVSPVAKVTIVEKPAPQPESWAAGMAHAVADKADELEMRAEILAEEAKESVHEAEHWMEGMAHAVADKIDELEMRAHIVAHEAAEGFKEGVADLEHAIEGKDALPQPQMLPENAADADEEVVQPPSADAATDVDETRVAPTHAAPVFAREKPPLDENDDQVKQPPEAAAAATVFAGDEDVAEGWAARLKKGLTKSRNHMAKSLAGVFGGGKIDEDLYEELETVLITSDMGIEATEQLMNEVRDRVSLRGLKDGNQLRAALKEAVYDLLKPLEQPLVLPESGQPFVIMMAGINGAGKTTSIGKLAKYFQAQGKTVMLAAGDTFRAAAREQLQEWGERNGVTVISQEKGDSAAVCFDAVEAAKARGIDVVLADTAGRLPTQLHLMEEIKKVKRVLQKAMPEAPHEVMLVLDANIGQNAVNQVRAFDDALGVTGLIVTKLDGTAKGGVLAALASDRAIPVRYIGVGESIDDLRPFSAKAFVDALLDEQ